MESPPLVCYSMGSINSLVEKITLLMENHPMLKPLLQDTRSLRDDLLNKLAGGKAKGEQVKVWMKQAREMAYDIEDWIDLKQEAASFSDSDMKQIDRFKEQVKEARDRCERYELLKQAQAHTSGARPCEVVAGRRLLWEEKTVLFGTEGPKSELLNHLKEEQNDLKVVSIHGMGGLGKTALAKDICGDIYIKGEFKCQAFVSVGRMTSTRTILIEILRQVKSEEDSWQYRSCSEIIKELWGFLRTKRYFVCIDDLRNTQDTEVIICALPNNNLGSRILVTTRVEDIAISCSRRPDDVVYEMVALGKSDSERLFLNSVYVPEEKWPKLFKESSNKIIEVCGGVPLAIIITAGLLGRTPDELPVQLDKLEKSNSSEFQFNSTSEAMRRLLDISYGDLPLPMKSCFLYFSAFPGNYTIKKDRLIQRWVAEGLIPEFHGKSSRETGECYFDELISRRLILPAFDDNDDQPIGCTVHGVVFDYMVDLSSEENFFTMGAELKSGLVPYDRVRRVSLAYGNEDDEGETLNLSTYCLLEEKNLVASSCDQDEGICLHLSRVRSLAFSGDAGMIPDLSAFKHVRVLDLEDTMGLENKQLGSIGSLSLLRYLGLSRTDVKELPKEVLALEQLSTLNLRQSRARLPEFRSTNKLVSLLADQLIIMRRMGGMKNLEELSRVLVGRDGSDADDVASIVSGSGRLRMLGVTFGRLFHQNNTDRQGVKHFLEEVGRSNLRSLLLDNYMQPLLDLLANSWATGITPSLQKFELRVRGRLPRVPEEVASLAALTHLHINVEAVDTWSVRALGRLPKLAVLEIYSCTSPSLTVTGEDGFQCLKVLWYNSGYGAGMGLKFDVGAMPQLRRLRLDLDARGISVPTSHGFDFGIQNLPNLVQVHATIDWVNATSTAPDVVEAEEARIREQVSGYPNNPLLELNRRRQRPVAKAPEELVITINSHDEWIKQIDPNKLVVVHFTTTWCRASSVMAPVFADHANKFRDVAFLKVDVEADEEMSGIAQHFDVDGVPTFLFIKGGSEVDRVVGAEKEELENKLEDHAVA